jgi:hypothetical protein
MTIKLSKRRQDMSKQIDWDFVAALMAVGSIILLAIFSAAYPELLWSNGL